MNFKKSLFLDFFLIFVIFLLGLYCSKGLFREYAFSTHDGDHHISRSFDAIQSLKEGNFPLRWAGSLNDWCGVPVFNFFYPLIYYEVFLINFLVKDVINSLKVIASLSFTIAPVFFYLWLKKETRNALASFVGAFLYLFVPYRFSLVYVRFNPEFVAYTFLPIVLWIESFLLERLRKDKLISFKTLLIAFVLSLIGGIFITSHNFAVMLLVPILVIYSGIKIYLNKIFDKQKIALLIFVFVSLLGISAFFWGPMILEKKYVKLNTMWTINYRDHFPELWQVIRSKWDYGSSEVGTEKDGMSFMLGYSQWLVIGASAFYVILYIFQKKKSKIPIEIIFWFSVSCLSLFLILPWSRFVWNNIKILQEIQFPWRLLGITSFTIAALSGLFLASIKNKFLLYFLSVFFLALAFVGNRNHLRPQPSANPEKYVDYEKNHDHRYATTSIFDDILGKESVSLCLPGTSTITSPLDSSISWVVERGNTFGKISFNNSKKENISLRLGLEFFPGTYLMKFNQESVNTIRNCQGRVCLDNLKFYDKENTLEWQIVQSPVERFFNMITLLTLFAWIAGLFLVLLRKDEKKTRQVVKT